MRYRSPTRSAQPPGHPVLVYDGECPFCTLVARLVARFAREPVELLPYQSPAIDDRGILGALDDRERAESAHYISADGVEYHGGASVTRALRLLPGGRLAAVFDTRALSRLRDLAYTAVSRARPAISPLVAWLWPAWRRERG